MEAQVTILDDINPKTTHLVRTCWENGPSAIAKNYDQLETWRKEKTRSSQKNLERCDSNSHEWKRSQNGRMEQSKAMEYESRKAVLKPRYIYTLLNWLCSETPGPDYVVKTRVTRIGCAGWASVHILMCFKTNKKTLNFHLTARYALVFLSRVYLLIWKF
jgi:hypothetical protein